MLGRQQDGEYVSWVFISRPVFPSVIPPGEMEASDMYYWLGDFGSPRPRVSLLRQVGCLQVQIGLGAVDSTSLPQNLNSLTWE